MNFPFTTKRRGAKRDQARQWQLEVGGRAVPVTMKHHATAKRFILRFNKTRDGLIVTVPPGAREREAFLFAQRQHDWISARLESRPALVPFEHGAVIPVRGDRHLIAHCPGTARHRLDRGRRRRPAPALRRRRGNASLPARRRLAEA